MPIIASRVARNVVSLDEATSCVEAARVMAEKRIGAVGVLRQGRLVGIVTERDLVYTVMARGTGAPPLSEVMNPNLPTVTPQATERDCAHFMQNHFTRHLLVKEGDQAVGVISMIDVLQLMLEDNRWLIERLHFHIRGGKSEQ
jgi:CBS domain-containing protein